MVSNPVEQGERGLARVAERRRILNCLPYFGPMTVSTARADCLGFTVFSRCALLLCEWAVRLPAVVVEIQHVTISDVLLSPVFGLFVAVNKCSHCSVKRTVTRPLRVALDITRCVVKAWQFQD